MLFYIVLGLLLLVYYVFKNCKYDYWETKGVPTASGNEWFFGNLRPVILLKKHFIKLQDDMYKEFPDAPLVGYYAMNVPMLMVKDLDVIKTILVAEFSSFSFSGMMCDKNVDPFAAVHPFFLKGEEWKSSRAQVIPSLTLTRLKGYLPNMLKVGDEMVKFVKKNCVGSAEMETRKLSMTYSTDVVGTAVYSIENNTFENKDSLISHLTREIQFETYLSNNIQQIIKQLPIIRGFFSSRIVSQKLQDVMVAVTRKVIQERLRTGENRNDLIQLLLAQKGNDSRGVFTDEYIAAQVFIFIIDLYETGSNAISAILFLLAVHSDIQEKLRSEIQEIKLRNNGDFTIEDIEGAKYLDMVFNETFRLFSLNINRECTSDCYIPMPGSEPFKITKGTSILIPVTSIHKDPKYYPNPEKFDPNRFSTEEVAKRPKFTYMPFGEGPKKCIGTRIVTLHIKIAIIKMIDNFKLRPSPKTKYPIEVDPHYSLTIRPKGGAWVIFEPIRK